MNRKLTLSIVAVALALLVAVPALAQTTTPKAPGNVQSLSLRALAKARLALLTARSAKKESRRAARTADAAFNEAKAAKELAGKTQGPVGPQGPTGPIGPRGPAAASIVSDVEPGTVDTESATYEALGGPSVTVEVPASGFIEVWAQVRFQTEGTVALFEDGVKMPRQAQECGLDEEGTALLSSFASTPLTLATPAGVPLLEICGGFGPPSPVLFETTPGTHTYELRYSIGCGCEPEATFAQRRLYVAPRP